MQIKFRRRMSEPLTTGEIEELCERWMQFAEDDGDWDVVRALCELLRIREAQDAAAIARMERDEEPQFVGVCG